MTYFQKYSNFTFHENRSSERRVIPCGLSDEQTNMKKLIVAFRNSVIAPENG